ncbi:MAG TPA: MBL fold metallo-hydrolase [Baekduia sp.]|jgi:glyoxylase-like metal-dependent hydrolase (beta-lactamase superfamily II)
MARADRAIRALAIPTPFAVGDVNAYLIEDDPLTLVDGGPNSATALAHLEGLLAGYGHRVEDIGLLVVTHQHADHMGLTGHLAARSGAPIAALAGLASYLERWNEAGAADDQFAYDLMLRHGVEPRVAKALRAVARMTRGWGAPCVVERPLADGDELELAGGPLRVLARPGHSPSDTVFHDEERGVLIGGDHLLSRVSSNALIARPLSLDPETPLDGARPQPLLAYRASLQATHALDVDVVLGGHGAPVTAHRTLIDERLADQERRATQFLEVLKAGPASAHDLALSIWGEVAITQAYLTISEVLGHLDLLLEAHLIEEHTTASGLTRFTRVG